MKIFALIMLLSLRMPYDTCGIEIPELEVSAKNNSYISDRSVSATILGTKQLETGRVESVKNLSGMVPNFYQPDYGSAMTSSIYVRGFGSRIDQPVLGLNVDEVPVMNKNGYDFDLFDIYNVEVLRGPQSTLYGRNTSGGVINLRTLSPLSYSGTRIGIDYGSANSFKIKMSHYKKTSLQSGLAVGLLYGRTDGFFRNEYSGENCDAGYRTAMRVRFVNAGDRVRTDNTFSVSWLDQGGFAYRPYEEGAVNYNDASVYSRLLIQNGTSFKFFPKEGLMFSSITGLQYLDDDMYIDNDFTPSDIFALRQQQREYSFTQDFVLRSTDDDRRWKHVSGLFGFYKILDADAPVDMKREGIEELILAGANHGINMVFPGHYIDIAEDKLVFDSSFRIPVFGAAFYHQSDWQFGKFKITAGLRIDYEKSAMYYDSEVGLNYRFTLTMPSYAQLSSGMHGRRSTDFFAVLPKASLMYETSFGNIYAVVSRGYKAGGFNIQIFSDLLRSVLMEDMMDALDMRPSGSGVNDAAGATTYAPEYTWNYEMGGHFSFGSLSLDAALFYIDCRNQQMTVFPSSTSMGRIMSNAGRSVSYGAEISAVCSLRDFRLSASWGYAHAEFRKYMNGGVDFSGKHIPYSPQSTFSAACLYTLETDCDLCDVVTFNVQADVIGKIYWNDANTLVQDPYGLLSVTATLRKGAYGLSFWGRNLTDRVYDTFYFESLGKGFLSSGHGRQLGVTLSFEM